MFAISRTTATKTKRFIAIITKAGPAKAHIDPSLGDSQQLKKKAYTFNISELWTFKLKYPYDTCEKFNATMVNCIIYQQH